LAIITNNYNGLGLTVRFLPISLDPEHFYDLFFNFDAWSQTFVSNEGMRQGQNQPSIPQGLSQAFELGRETTMTEEKAVKWLLRTPEANIGGFISYI
jgi:hypothetical protein